METSEETQVNLEQVRHVCQKGTQEDTYIKMGQVRTRRSNGDK